MEIDCFIVALQQETNTCHPTSYEDSVAHHSSSALNSENLYSSTEGIPCDDEFETVESCFIPEETLIGNTLTFKRVLQHFAAYTNQKKSHLTYLLRLLKEHQPIPDYDSLPSSGQQLMSISDRDKRTMRRWPSNHNNTVTL